MSARVSRLEAALQLLGEDSPDAAPLKVALDQARGQAKNRPSWGIHAYSSSSG